MVVSDCLHFLPPQFVGSYHLVPDEINRRLEREKERGGTEGRREGVWAAAHIHFTFRSSQFTIDGNSLIHFPMGLIKREFYPAGR